MAFSSRRAQIDGRLLGRRHVCQLERSQQGVVVGAAHLSQHGETAWHERVRDKDLVEGLWGTTSCGRSGVASWVKRRVLARRITVGCNCCQGVAEPAQCRDRFALIKIASNDGRACNVS